MSIHSLTSAIILIILVSTVHSTLECATAMNKDKTRELCRSYEADMMICACGWSRCDKDPSILARVKLKLSMEKDVDFSDPIIRKTIQAYDRWLAPLLLRELESRQKLFGYQPELSPNPNDAESFVTIQELLEYVNHGRGNHGGIRYIIRRDIDSVTETTAHTTENQPKDLSDSQPSSKMINTTEAAATFYTGSVTTSTNLSTNTWTTTFSVESYEITTIGSSTTQSSNQTSLKLIWSTESTSTLSLPDTTYRTTTAMSSELPQLSLTSSSFSTTLKISASSDGVQKTTTSTTDISSKSPPGIDTTSSSSGTTSGLMSTTSCSSSTITSSISATTSPSNTISSTTKPTPSSTSATSTLIITTSTSKNTTNTSSTGESTQSSVVFMHWTTSSITATSAPTESTKVGTTLSTTLNISVVAGDTTSLGDANKMSGSHANQERMTSVKSEPNSTRTVKGGATAAPPRLLTTTKKNVLQPDDTENTKRANASHPKLQASASKSDNDEGFFSLPIIIMGVIAGLILILVVAFFVWFLMNSKKRRRRRSITGSSDSTMTLSTV